jgi:hypothetical protein
MGEKAPLDAEPRGDDERRENTEMCTVSSVATCSHSVHNSYSDYLLSNRTLTRPDRTSALQAFLDATR